MATVSPLTDAEYPNSAFLVPLDASKLSGWVNVHSSPPPAPKDDYAAPCSTPISTACSIAPITIVTAAKHQPTSRRKICSYLWKQLLRFHSCPPIQWKARRIRMPPPRRRLTRKQTACQDRDRAALNSDTRERASTQNGGAQLRRGRQFRIT